MDVRQFAFLARQPLRPEKSFQLPVPPEQGLALVLANAMFWQLLFLPWRTGLWSARRGRRSVRRAMACLFRQYRGAQWQRAVA